MHKGDMKMKEKLTLRNVVIWGAAFLGLLFFFLSFAVKAQVYGPGEGGQIAYVTVNALWGGNSMEIYFNGQLAESGAAVGKPFVLPIIGVILLLVAVIGAVVVSFLVKDNKLSKILLIASGALAVVGGVFVFFVGESGLRTFAYLMMGDEGLNNMDMVRAEMKEAGFKSGPRALGVILGIVAILVGGSFAAAPFLPEKKLVK